MTGQIPFTSFAFAATGGPTKRTMPDRLAEVKNVLDFGADPTGGNPGPNHNSNPECRELDYIRT